mgnify:CR=1 FL=1
MSTLLEVKNLTVSYGAIKALHDISFSVEDKEVITLIGSNGAGKTTTLHAVSNILKKDAGSVFFDGEDITDCAPDKIVERKAGAFFKTFRYAKTSNSAPICGVTRRKSGAIRKKCSLFFRD